MTVVRIPEPSLVRGGSYVITPASPESIGCLGGFNLLSQSTAYPTASRCIFVPFQLDRLATAYQMFTQNGTAVGNNVDVGLYDYTMASLVTIGSTAQAGTGASGFQTYDIADTILLPGRYFLGLSCDGTTSTFGRYGYQPRQLRLMGCLEKLSTFPLPTGAVTTTVVANSGYIPNFGVVLQGAV